MASKAKAKANEIVTTADRRDTFTESAPSNRNAKTRARDSKKKVTSAVKRGVPRGSARKAKKEGNQKEKETHTKGKAQNCEVVAKASGG